MALSSGINGSSNRNQTHNSFERENRVGNRDTDAARQEDAQNARGGNNRSASVGAQDQFVSAGRPPAEVTGEGPGGTELRAHAGGPSLEVSGGAEGSIDSSGVHLDVNIDVDATLAEAGAGATKTFTADIHGEEVAVEVSLDALGKIGAEGNVNLSVDIGADGVNISASAEGFAGAQASLTGGISVSHEGTEIASGSATLSATAGVSGSASANLDVSGGKVSFGAQAAASAGAGFGVEVQGTVDTAAAANATLDIGAAALRDGAEEVAEFAAEFGGNVQDFAGDRARDVVNVAQDVGGFVVDGAGTVANAADKAVDFINPF